MIQKIEEDNLVSTNTTRFIKYSLIIVLSIGLYFTWLQKDKFEATSLKLKEKTQKLNQKIKTLKNNLQKSYLEKTNQKIEIILPEEKKNYEDMIPKQNYKDLDFRKDEILPSLKLKGMEVKPNITFDENKDIDKVEVKIEKKF